MSEFKRKADDINQLLLSYASGDYSARGNISNELDELDSIINGINMVGEELLTTTISRDYFSSIYNAVSEMLFVVTNEGLILDVNTAACNNLDYDREELINQDISKVLYHDRGNFFNKLVHKLSKGSKLFKANTKLQCSDKTILPVSATCTCIFDRFDAFNGYLIVTKDITDQLETESKIFKAIVEAQHREQKRVAEDLHDSLGQELSAVKLYMNSLDKLIKKADPKFSEAYFMAKQILDDTISGLRAICFDLMPSTLEYGNIDLALRELLSKFMNQEIIQFSYDCTDNLPELSKDLEIVIFRLAQEFINNTIKHAEAKHVNVELLVTNNILQLTIRDDGKGFNLKEYSKSGRGLRNFQSRIKAFNGQAKLNSKINEGTELRVIFPLKQ